MIHKIEFTIDIDTNGLYDEDYFELQKLFFSKLKESDSNEMTFDEINNILHLDKRKYFPSNIEYPEMNPDYFDIKITRINIKA